MITAGETFSMEDVMADKFSTYSLVADRVLDDLIATAYDFSDRDQAREFFTRLTSLYKNWNYSGHETPAYQRYREEMEELAGRFGGQPERRAADRSAKD